jgi:hypothetical protein
MTGSMNRRSTSTAYLTVSFHTVKAAIAKPIDNLRME